jgi:hypothetical protein
MVRMLVFMSYNVRHIPRLVNGKMLGPKCEEEESTYRAQDDSIRCLEISECKGLWVPHFRMLDQDSLLMFPRDHEGAALAGTAGC